MRYLIYHISDICFISIVFLLPIQVDLNDVDNIDIVFDGVDEVDFNKNLLKV